jgi:hypothetical protein
MSLETWKEEFYFVDASEVPVKQAVQHSLRKWIGLRQENLEKHDLSIEGKRIYGEDGRLFISESSCALCRYYIEDYCCQCPLYAVLGRPCDAGLSAPYQQFVFDGNPEPMIRALSEIE